MTGQNAEMLISSLDFRTLHFEGVCLELGFWDFEI
jgi:hypothetical protein